MQQTQALLRTHSDLASDADAELIRRIAAGDRAALAELYALHERPVFRYICQITADRGMAEEILQDTLLAVWQSAASFEQRSTVRLWLLGIARRQAHNTLRRRRLPMAEVEDLDEIADQGASPEGRALAQFDRDQIARAVTRLPMPQRETLSLVLVEGLSYRDAAEVLGVPEGTVKSRLNKARRTLRIALGSRAEVES